MHGGEDEGGGVERGEVTDEKTGTIEAVYIYMVQEDRMVPIKTVEFVRNVLLADFDSTGRLVGIEILGPLKPDDFTMLAGVAKVVLTGEKG